MDQVRRGTRPTRDGIQAVRSKLGRPSSVIRLSMRTPILGVVAGTPAGLLDTQLANDLDIHDAAQIQRFPPPQV
jgi:hypothetical protein